MRIPIRTDDEFAIRLVDLVIYGKDEIFLEFKLRNQRMPVRLSIYSFYDQLDHAFDEFDRKNIGKKDDTTMGGKRK